MTAPNVEGVAPTTEPLFTDADKPTADTPPSKPGRRRRPTTRAERRAAGETSAQVKKDRAPRAPRAVRAVPIGPRVAELHLLVGSVLDIGASVAIPGVGQLPPAVGRFGGQLVTDAEQFGAAWESYARANPRVREALERLLTVSELGTILALYGKAVYVAVQPAMPVEAVPPPFGG